MIVGRSGSATPPAFLLPGRNVTILTSLLLCRSIFPFRKPSPTFFFSGTDEFGGVGERWPSLVAKFCSQVDVCHRLHGCFVVPESLLLLVHANPDPLALCRGGSSRRTPRSGAKKGRRRDFFFRDQGRKIFSRGTMFSDNAMSPQPLPGTDSTW